MKQTKRLLALLLTLAMLMVNVPAPVFAVGTTNEDGYIEVRTIEDLYNVRNDLTANYILMNDIDLTAATAEGGDWDYGGRGWNPIGSGDNYGSTAFSGIFNGNGHKIIGMRIHTATYPTGVANPTYAGLFANVVGTVQNLTMENINISDGCDYTGAIAGNVNKTGTIESCAVTGGTIAKGSYMGGIAGQNYGTISACFNACQVSGSKYAGGIAGYNYSVIINCYNTGAIIGTSSADVGGIAGINTGDNYYSNSQYATIKQSYSVGTVSATSNSYAYAITMNSGKYVTLTNVYYRTGAGVGSTGATALTEAQLKLQSTYSGFDFDSVWYIDANAVYPYPQLKNNPQDTRVITEAKIATMPTKVKYLQGEELNMAGCTLEFAFANAETEYVTVTNSMVTGFDKKGIGEQTLTISCYGRSFTFTITMEEHPFVEVYTILDLYNIRYNLNGNYILMNDIDLTAATAEGGDWDFGGRGWNPIGSYDIYSNGAFTGIFDGNGHSIIGMRVNYNSSNYPDGMGSDAYVGLFANNEGIIRNLHMESVNIQNAYANATLRGGAIAGTSAGTIQDCNVTGIINLTSYGDQVGGVVGRNYGGIIERCYNAAAVSGQTDVGGIVGIGSGTIKNCYNTGNIKATTTAGGISGQNAVSSDPGNILNCYNIGTITGGSKTLGYAIADSVYGTIANAYYLTNSGAGAVGATALTEAQLRIKSPYEGFDFEAVWQLDAQANYPYPQLIENPQDMRIIKSAQIYTLPQKTIYELGEKFNSTGLVLEFLYENAEAEYVNITTDQVTGFDASVLGKQTLSVTHHNRTFTFDVTVTEKPYKEIYTIQDLYNIRLDLTGNYILMNDIDLTEATANGGEWDFDGRGWNPIGSNDIYTNGAFSGIFDGNGHKITGMRIEYSNANVPSGMGRGYVGLFAYVSGEVRNLHMENVQILNAYGDSSYSYGGAVAGYNAGAIRNCSVTGTVKTTSTFRYTGGITGYNKGTVDSCFNNADVTGYYYAGGIAGSCVGGTIQNSYNTGTVKTTYGNSNYEYSGGIVARLEESGIVQNCYNTGAVEGRGSKYGIAYKYSGTIKNSYYLAGTGANSTGATALTEAQMKIGNMFAGFDFETVWTINSDANYPYPQLQGNIQDMSETVELIRVIAYPAKLDYLTGDELLLTGGMFEAVYISGKTEMLAITADMISGYDPTVVGTQTLTVTYGGQTDTFVINVARRPAVTAMTLVSEPTIKEFVVGTAFDFAGAKVNVTYDNNTSKTLDITVDMTTGGNINHIGTQTITVSLDGKTVSFSVKVVPASLDGISVSKLPNKVVYLEGEQLDTTGMEIVAVYTNGSQVKIASGYTISNFTSKPGVQTVTVEFAGKTTTFEVTVQARPLNNLQIQAKPDKLDYVAGQELDLTGMLVVAYYANGDVEIVEDYEISGYDNTAGTKVITVSYGGKTAAFTVLVTVKSVTKVEIKQLPAKLEYIENEALSVDGMIVEATYNDGTVVEVTDYDLVGFSSNPGRHELLVSFCGQVDSFVINVTAKVLSDIRVTLPKKTVYALGEAFDATGLTVTACYNNGVDVVVDNYTMAGFDSNTAGAKTITISYGGLVRTFAVVVEERSVIDTNGTFAIGNVIGRLGEEVRVPVTVTNNAGIAGLRHEISFEASNLTLVGVEMQGDYAKGTLIVNNEKTDEGKATIVWFCGYDVKSNGAVYELVFEVKETAVDGITEVKLDFAENDNGNISGENVRFGDKDGSVEIRSYWLGDLDGDRKFAMVDLVMLAQYVADFDMTLTAKQELSADVNEDGAIDIHDVILLNQWLLAEDF